jgi:hypothetical protein
MPRATVTIGWQKLRVLHSRGDMFHVPFIIGKSVGCRYIERLCQGKGANPCLNFNFPVYTTDKVLVARIALMIASNSAVDM